MNKNIFLWLGIVGLVLVLGIISLTDSQTKAADSVNQTSSVGEYSPVNDFANQTSKVTSVSPVEKVEVYHFHRTRQCPTCIRIGNLTELTVKTYFQKDIDSGKLVFAHINVELPENTQLAEKYGATGSSLMIGVYREDGNFSKAEDTNVWYEMGNQEGYLSYMKGVIEQKLAGK